MARKIDLGSFYLKKPIKRILILGTVGSGKSTLAKKISSKKRIKHYDLDDIYWTNALNVRRNRKEKINLLKNIFKTNEWVAEGVYTEDIHLGIRRSNLVILLDTPFYMISWRIIKRMIKKEKSKEIGSGRYKETWRGLIELLKVAKRYKKKSNPKGYYLHKKIISRHPVNFIILKSKKDLNHLINSIK